mgnify:CR=1 FL=1
MLRLRVMQGLKKVMLTESGRESHEKAWRDFSKRNWTQELEEGITERRNYRSFFESDS